MLDPTPKTHTRTTFERFAKPQTTNAGPDAEILLRHYEVL
jgi:hypothetical protein